ncbi:MAG: hypothetical protein WC501_01665 [Candidatus Micrarchaeia archaeon]
MKRSLYKGIPSPDENLRKKTSYEGRGKKSSNILPISIAIIVVAVVLGYVFIFSEGNGIVPDLEDIINGNETINANNTNQTQPEEIDPQTYLLGKAISEKNVSLCAELETKKQDCYEALYKDSEDACLMVEDYNKKMECVNYFSQIQNSTQICIYLNEADELECGKKINPCYGKTGEDENLCYALLYKNSGYCQKEQCMFEYASKMSDWTVCNNFTSASRFMACYSLADKKDHCKDLGFLSEKDHCYYLYSTASDDWAYCAMISEDSEYSFMCYNEFMIKTEDKFYCNQLSIGNNNKWKCLKNYALLTGNLEGCDLIDSLAKSNKESCYFNFAVEYYQPDKCNYLETISSKYNCYPQAIQNPEKPLPPENCKNITDTSWKAKCYQYSAKKNNDISICNSIDSKTQATTYELCMDQFN